MLTLRNLLMASAIAVCATSAVAQTAAPAAPDQAAAPAPRMIPIPCTDFSRMNRCNDPLVQARAGKSEGQSGGMNMGNMPGMGAPDQPKQ